MDKKQRRILVIGLLLVGIVFLSNSGSNSYFKRTIMRTISNVLSDQISSGVSDFVNSGSTSNSSNNKTSSSNSSSSSKPSSSSNSSKYEPKEDLDFVYDGNVCVGVLVNGSLKEFDSKGNLKGVSSKLNEYVKDDLKKRNKKWSTPTVN